MCFFYIVCNWKKIKPVLDKLIGNCLVIADVGLFVLENLSKTCDGVVTSMVVLGDFHLLGFDLWCHWEVDGRFQRGQAKVSCCSESFASKLCNYSNSIGSSLSHTSTLTSSKLANCGHNLLEVFCTKVGWSEVFNHIIKNENCEL